ncbi:hypothetical protein KAX29_02270 [candidate division WOR-3 bacterium]|jgi:hypothetical protein|nr:hypothetical protein [candidate division WOR-3 bacterium]
MAIRAHKARNIVKVVTIDGARFEGEISDRNQNGFYLRVQTPMGEKRHIFVSHHAISHLEFAV